MCLEDEMLCIEALGALLAAYTRKMDKEGGNCERDDKFMKDKPDENRQLASDSRGVRLLHHKLEENIGNQLVIADITVQQKIGFCMIN